MVVNVLSKLAQNKEIVVIRSIRHSGYGSGSVCALNVEDHDGQDPRVEDFNRRLVEIEEDLMQELTRSNGQQRPVVWTQTVLCKAGMGVPEGLLVVEGRAQG